MGFFSSENFLKILQKQFKTQKGKSIETSWDGINEKKIENKKPTDKSISGRLIKDFQLLGKLRVTVREIQSSLFNGNESAHA